MKKIFYEKVGRRYKPVYEYDQELMSAFPKGTHIVMCYPGGQSTRYNIDVNYAAMIAAGRLAEDVICQKMYEASEAKPKKNPVTKRQRAAWEEMQAAFGNEMFSLTFACSRDLAEAGIQAMQEEALKLMQNDAVRQAYEQFQLVCALTKNQKT
jgi:CRISPR/Cas system CSM-associated protein Csm2 small subunit